MGSQDIHEGPDEIRTEKDPEGFVINATYKIICFAGFMLPEGYLGLVYSKWLRSLRFGNDYFTLITAEAYYKSYHAHIFNLLRMPMTRVSFAVLSDDPDVVLGFSVHRGPILEYVYVHKDQRNQGIGTSLVPEGTHTITHVTKTGLTIWGSKYPKWKFNPFA